MLNFFKKNKKPEFALETIDEQCIPYACHYDKHSILTKNGELMQVIKIEGFSQENSQYEQSPDLRAVIRKSITENIHDRKVAIWFHTLRRKRNLDSINSFPWTFAKDTHEGWAEKNHWRDKFINELYITILYEGERYDTNKNFSLSFIPKFLKKLHLNLLEKNAKTLDDLTLKMLDILKTFGGKRLSVQHDKIGAHSEILEFLSKIICLNSKRIPMPLKNLDHIFTTSKIAFGGNVLEIIDNNEKRFAAVFSIKEYQEHATKALDKFLRISSEYVIAQTLNFVDSAEAKKSFEHLDYILKVSKDSEFHKNCGLTSILENDQGNITDYGTQQMTIMIIGATLEELERSVTNVVKEIRTLGMAAIREDLHMSLCFWSQLPGNFIFFRRTSYIDTKRTASFASLDNTPSGSTENIWGNALTLFRRKNASPHFFNLHVENNGNTLVVGKKASSRAPLVNFLISESSKYDPKLLYIDPYKTSKVTIKLLGGRHKTISLTAKKAALSLNPFSLDDTPENHEFLKEWLLMLIFPESKYNSKEEEKVSSSLEKFLAKMPPKKRQISMLLDFIEDKTIKDALSIWCGTNKFGLLFDNARDELALGAKMLGINIEELMTKENTAAIAPFVAYCLYKYKQTLDKTPSICIIHEASSLLEHSYFNKSLPIWLDDLTNNNALAILICDTKTPIHPNISHINDKIATHLFLPSTHPENHQKELQLTKIEIETIKDMSTMYRHFMIKQGPDNIVVELNLDGMDYAVKALNGKQDAIDAMDKAILKIGDNPNRWVIPFYKNLFPELN
jgi:type IV secretion system protein VirB4